MTKIEINSYINIELADIPIKMFFMKVKDLLPIYYVAVRGRDDVQGAVQRVLNKRRINSIKEFVLDGNSFFNLFILNWSDEHYEITEENGKIIIPQVPASVQVIDGQHRLEGLKQACEEKEIIGEKCIPVLLAEHLTTQEAAHIFLNINTEQKPAPSSLVYDLFGEVKDKNYYIVRATDIATRLHEDPESPYYQSIKMPGSSQGVGKVDLSTMVNVLKQYTKEKGVFEGYNLRDFESQYKVIFNFFSVLRRCYDKEGNWLKSCNPFMANSGAYAGIEFMCKELMTKCVERKSFEQSIINELLRLDRVGLIYKDELKNKQGKEQRSIIYEYLKSALLKDVPKQDEYKF